MEIQLVGLDKHYGNNHALKHLDLRIHHGIYALLGPNGAGKTTLMNLLTRSLAPDAGKILVNGAEAGQLGKQYLKMLGYMPQQQVLPGYFSALRFLYYIASLKGLDQAAADQQIRDALEKVNLWDRRNDRIGGFSGGMKQRLLIAQAILGDPDLIILDEPTAGLDPRERIRIRNMIASLRRDRIILIATHVVQDIECIADQILFLKKGEIIENLAPAELALKMPCKVYETILPGDSQWDRETAFHISMVNQESGGLRVRMLAEDKPCPNAVQKEPHLEDMYLALYGREA